MTHLAAEHELLERGQGLLVAEAVIGPVRLVKIDVVRLQLLRLPSTADMMWCRSSAVLPPRSGAAVQP